LLRGRGRRRCRRYGERQDERRRHHGGSHLRGTDGESAAGDVVAVAVGAVGAHVDQLEPLIDEQRRALQFLHRLADLVERQGQRLGHRGEIGAPVAGAPHTGGRRAETVCPPVAPVVDEKLVVQRLDDELVRPPNRRPHAVLGVVDEYLVPDLPDDEFLGA